MSESIYLRSVGPFLYDLLQQKFYGIKDGFVIGRVTGDLIFADDSSMSRSHVRIHLAGAGLRDAFVEDLGSTNGVVVNGVKVRAQQMVPLADGAVLEVGDQMLFFTYTQEIPHFAIDGGPVPKPTARKPPVSRPVPQSPVDSEPTRVGQLLTPFPPQTPAPARPPAPTAPLAPSPPPPEQSSMPNAAASLKVHDPTRVKEKPLVEASQMTRRIVRPARIKPLDIHPVIFKTTEQSGVPTLRIADISTSGLGFFRDPSFKWPVIHARISGMLVAGETSLNVTLKILKKTPLTVGCSFCVNVPEVQSFVERYFNIELAACDLINQGGIPTCFKSQHCEVEYYLELGKLSNWHLSFFGHRIDADAAGKLRLSSEAVAGSPPKIDANSILASAVRLLANIEEFDEDVRDGMCSLILANMQKR